MKTTGRHFDRRTTAAASILALALTAYGASAFVGNPPGANPPPPPPPPKPAATTTTTTSTTSTTAATSTSSTLETPTAISDGSGSVLTASGSIDHSNLFFQPFGNGRACSSCHQESQGWTVTPAALNARFTASSGTDPIFQLVDGANSPNERVSTLAQKQQAYSMLLSKGVIRVGLAMPSVADFQLITVEDPYDFASAQELSLFRRPLPATNLKFLSTVMWDARETLSASSGNCILNSNPLACFASNNADLLDQANSAVKTHAQFAAGLTSAQQNNIVNFESSLLTAQSNDSAAGSLSAAGATAGPAALANQNFYFGINDFFAGDYKTGARFNPNVFTLFTAWAQGATAGGSITPAQASIARGEAIFNTRPINITAVNGFNDVLNQPAVRGSCSSCHDTPNVGGASVPHMMNTGLAAGALRTPDLPLYTFRNASTGQLQQSSDPGYALQTGKWADIGKFKVPGLRGLAARPPYFHNGSAPNLGAVVAFYNRRFAMNLSPQEATDLTNFLQSL